MQSHVTLIKFACWQSPPPSPSSSLPFLLLPPFSSLLPPHQIHIHHFGHEAKASSTLDGIYIWHTSILYICKGTYMYAMEYLIDLFFTSGHHQKMWRHTFLEKQPNQPKAATKMDAFGLAHLYSQQVSEEQYDHGVTLLIWGTVSQWCHLANLPVLNLKWR